MEANLNGIPETLLITLWARAVETGRPDSLIRDQYAVKMMERIDYDFAKFEKAWLSQTGVAVRSQILDGATRSFIDQHPEGVIINIGCGLDTRFLRMNHDKIYWYDLDLPEAIRIRKKFFEETARYRMIAKSAFEISWKDEIRTDGRSVLIIAEGVLMYFEEERVRDLLQQLAEAFPGAEMLLEVMPPTLVKLSKKHDTVGKMGLRFQWGIHNRRELGTYDPRIRLTEEWNLFDVHPERWKWMRWPALLPVFKNRFNDRIAHLKVSESISSDQAI